MLIAVVGGPRTGKTVLSETLASLLGAKAMLISSDYYTHLGWSGSAEATKFAVEEARTPIVIAEGVRVEGAIRRGLKPDLVFWMRRAHIKRNEKQELLAQQVDARIAKHIKPHFLTVEVP